MNQSKTFKLYFFYGFCGRMRFGNHKPTHGVMLSLDLRKNFWRKVFWKLPFHVLQAILIIVSQ